MKEKVDTSNKENVNSANVKDPLSQQANRAYQKFVQQNQMLMGGGEVTLKKQNTVQSNKVEFVKDLTQGCSSPKTVLQERQDKIVSRGQRFEKTVKQNQTYDEPPQTKKDIHIYRTHSSNNLINQGDIKKLPLSSKNTESFADTNLKQFLTKRNSIHDYEIGQKLGEGAYAVVRQCRHKESNSRIAMKIYDKLKLNDPIKKRSVSREINLLQRLDHPNIVKFYESIDTTKTINLVMEHVKGKSLYTYLKNRRYRRLDESDAKMVFKQIVEGVNYLHKQNIAHRDLKPDNILIDEKVGSTKQLEYTVKLIDFGFSVAIQGGQKQRTFCGTPSYMSPEIVSKKEYCGKQVDIWALGIILFNMVYGRCPFRAENERDLYRKIAKGQFGFPDEVYSKQEEYKDLKISSSLKNLLKKILAVNGDNRPSCSEILSHEWFKINV